MEKWIEDNGQVISGVIGFTTGVILFVLPPVLLVGWLLS